MKKIIAIIVLFILAGLVFAHQPRLVSGFTEIKNPEVSQAFYSELKGEPAYYRIDSNVSFSFYVGILVPAIEGVDKDISVEIIKEDETILLNGRDYNWTYYYEEFTGDGYYKGPELRSNSFEEISAHGVNVTSGVYNIKVFSSDNKGKYVLVIGDKEEFQLNDMINTIFLLPKMKSEFFGKPWYTSYFNMIGFYLLVLLAFVIGIVTLLILSIIKLLKPRTHKYQV